MLSHGWYRNNKMCLKTNVEIQYYILPTTFGLLIRTFKSDMVNKTHIFKFCHKTAEVKYK